MITFNLKALLAPADASPADAIAVEVSPDRCMTIDRRAWEHSQIAFREFAESIPGTESGPSYQALKPYAGNGDLAKLLIALGDLAGVWKMHPPVRHPELWGKSPLYPMIAASSVAKPEKRRVPKPSAGDLEADTATCTCCERTMGPFDTRIHDLAADAEQPALCSECGEVGCRPGGPCELDKPRPKEKRAAFVEEEAPDNLSASDDDAFSSYVAGFKK